MVQNHILQLVCLVAMEPPSHFTADQVRDENYVCFRHCVRSPKKILSQASIRTMSMSWMVHTNRDLCCLRMGIENWRWAGVPFYIRTGKKLSLRSSEIVITFNQSHMIFSKRLARRRVKMICLTVWLSGFSHKKASAPANLESAGPGGMRLFPSELNLSFNDTFSARLPDAYERLLMDTARGNQTLFMRHDEVLAAWALSTL